ncbi:AAA family ATPase, partial [Singulisphaera rosea]
MFHVHKLEVESFKGVRAVTIEFPDTGGVVEVCGANHQGKSSVIDAICAAVGGLRESPTKPIREGSLRARSTVDLGDLLVVRTWDSGGSKLTVTAKEGSKISRPQEVLDRLFDRRSIDPAAFARLKQADQAETLRDLAGLDFGEIDREISGLKADRTNLTRLIKQQEAKLAGTPQVEPTEPVDIDALNAMYREASVHNSRQLTIHDRADDKSREVTSLLLTIANLEANLAEAKQRLEAAQAAKARLESSMVDIIDTTKINEEINTAWATNDRARAYRERQSLEDALRESQDESDRLKDKIKDAEDRRYRILDEAKFPVEGLSVDGDVVTYRGVPFDQVSASESIRVSLAIAAALNPELGLIVIKDGSLLDETTLRDVAE